MANTEREVATDIDEKSLFAGAMSDEAEAEVHTEPEAEAKPDLARDDLGRFAAKEPEKDETHPVQQPEQTRQDDVSDRIPAWRLREEAEGRRQAEQRYAELQQQLAMQQAQHQQLQAQLQSFQKPQEAPEIWSDPNAWGQHQFQQQIAPLQQQIQQMRVSFARDMAESRYGADEVRKAQDEFDRAVHSGAIDPADHQRVMSAQNPFAAAVDWSRRSKVLSEVGNDPNAWFENKLNERMADPAFQAKVLDRIRGTAASQKSPNNVTRLPPSLNRSSGSAVAERDDVDMSDKGLLSAALRRN